jgi:NAD-dependent deacetylase
MPASLDALQPTIAAIAGHLRQARRVCFITGAGISAESGLPTYRGIGGLYNDIVPEEGLPIEDILSGRTFRRKPALTWKYIARIEAASRGASANVAHHIIAAFEARFDVCVITQNVDGLHRAAGSRNVIDLHGDIHALACTRCGWRDRVPDYSVLAMPPACPDCGAIARPQVVLFGEMLPDAAVGRYREEVARGFDVVFAIGTTAAFPYIIGPVRDAAARAVPTIEVNPAATDLSAVVRYRLPIGAGAALAAITAELEGGL